MNYIRTEVTETAADHRYDDAKPVAHDGQAGPAGQTMALLLSAMAAVQAEPIAGSSPRKMRASSGLAPWQVLRVRDYVEATLSGIIHVSCLARIAKLSTSHFARAFRVSFGVTPAAYVVVRRVERAKRMMLSTTEPLCRISLDCGFTDQSHLSRAFRRQVGESPSQWRRWHRLA